MPLDDQLDQQRRPTSRPSARSASTAYPQSLRRHRQRLASWSSATAPSTGEALEASRAPRCASPDASSASAPSARRASSCCRTAARRVQVYVRQDALSGARLQGLQAARLRRSVGVAGRVFRTKTNELTVWASSLTFLAKCFLPLPEKWHGLQDVETRYRQRYLDLDRQPRLAPGVRDSQPRR